MILNICIFLVFDFHLHLWANTHCLHSLTLTHTAGGTWCAHSTIKHNVIRLFVLSGISASDSWNWICVNIEYLFVARMENNFTQRPSGLPFFAHYYFSANWNIRKIPSYQLLSLVHIICYFAIKFSAVSVQSYRIANQNAQSTHFEIITVNNGTPPLSRSIKKEARAKRIGRQFISEIIAVANDVAACVQDEWRGRQLLQFHENRIKCALHAPAACTIRT